MRLLVPLGLAGVLLAGCSDQTPTAPPEPSATPPSPAGTPAAASPSAPAAAQARAVYWLGASKEPRGPRLYREFVRRPAGPDPVRDALETMFGSEPKDPDYTSLWAEGTTVRDVRRDGTTAVVDLSREALQSGGGSGFEGASIQQLVHTVTAADPDVRAVQLLVDGERVETLWGHADLTKPVSRAPAAEVLGPVWLDVEEGGTIRGDFGGTATVFEATVSWEFRQGDRVVQEGFSTASEGAPGRGDWTGTADVPPGDYELWAYESSARDGSVTWLDTKRVTVS
ncbi:MAG: Gmad2 immunoglobulin-like domain-containing protein [Mycobacteriales bacterium]